jgi:hypothetical protein
MAPKTPGRVSSGGYSRLKTAPGTQVHAEVAAAGRRVRGARARSVSPLSSRHADPSATHRPQTPHTAPRVHCFMPATPLRGTLTVSRQAISVHLTRRSAVLGLEPETNGLTPHRSRWCQ